MVSMVSAGLDLGGRGYGVSAGVVGAMCLWCLMVWTWVVGAMVFMVSAGLDLGGPGYGVSGVWAWVVGAMVSMVSAGLDLGGGGYGVSGVWARVVGLLFLWCLMVWTWVMPLDLCARARRACVKA